ncbi:MAG: phosphoenolpyruvate--protein phosphotransferase [Elusimicrobiales bacterium]|nr:phosphoenolpyruvate--protein phosphotransferase [Elusimicrobiales bacterium]
MIVKRGIGINVGIAIGKTFILEDDAVIVEKKVLPREKIKDEVARYKMALSKTSQELELVKSHVLEALGRQHAKLIDAHSMILKDPLITKDVIGMIVNERVNAEYALSKKIEEVLKKFEKITDTFFIERKNEIIDISKKIIQNLTNKKPNIINQINKPVVLVANNLLPSDLINISKSPYVIAFCTNLGSKTSHTALFAQNMGIPAVLGLGDITKIVKNDTNIIVSSGENSVIIDPTPEMMDVYIKKKEQLAKSEIYLNRIKKLPTVTRDGRKITLMVNLDRDDSIDEYKNMNSDGIGLFRTEFLYLNRDSIPSEDEQVNVYRKILTSTPSLPIVIRTADIGADKVSNIGFKDIISETNPFMGFRGIRLFLRYPDLLKTQIKAIYRASLDTNVHIMIPMVTNLDEIIQVRAIIDDIKKELYAKRITFKEDIPLGVMIEVPSAALIVDYILDYVDFISIGTNDLIQYLLAVDRVNQYVSNMYDPFHPAVLRILNLIVSTAHKKGKKVSVCGEMASDPLGAIVLLSLGVDALSVPLKLFLKVKQHIRSLNYDKLSFLGTKILNESDSSKVVEMIEKEMIYEFK